MFDIYFKLNGDNKQLPYHVCNQTDVDLHFSISNEDRIKSLLKANTFCLDDPHLMFFDGG